LGLFSDDIEGTDNCEIVHSEQFAERCSFGSFALVDANSESDCHSKDCTWDEVSAQLRTDSHCLKPSNILFDEYHRIQIADCGWSGLDSRESAATARGVASEFEAPEMRSGEECNAMIDFFLFALIV
jgi:hypothetical protein